MDYSDSFSIIQGARASNADCVLRIRKDGYMSFFRPLEEGVAGIMVPHCMSADEAHMAVRNAKYHPMGMRGIDMVGVDADYMLANGMEHIK